MAQCYRRKIAYLDDNGLHFRSVVGARVVTIPCGKCIACRTNNAASWATRAMHESKYCDSGCFVTLTYNPEHCPDDYAVNKRDVQLFLKRLRKHIEPSRIRAYFAVGEYGTQYGRPHYHILIFGWSPSDLVYHSKSYAGDPIYTSATLERIWGKGFCPVGTITGGSAAYVARYSKKCLAPNNGKRPPAFFLASRNIPLSNGKQGALGAQWLIDHHNALRFGYVQHPDKVGIKCKIPDYYFDLLKRWYPADYERIKALRYQYAMDAQHGYYFVADDAGCPTVMLPRDYTPEDILALKEFCGVDLDNDDITVYQLQLMARDIVRRMDDAQSARLNTLKRNYER